MGSGMIGTYLALAAAAALLLYAVLIYNGLVTLRNGVTKAWSNIDVLLKQRHDEIPKLVEVCRAYMQFERETLEKVMLARAGSRAAQARGDVAGVAAAEGPLRGGIGRIAATVEAYPELKANQSIMQLLARITALENEISDRREFYNEYANNNNVRIAEFPDVIVARLGGFQPAPLLHFSAEEIADVDVRALFRNAGSRGWAAPSPAPGSRRPDSSCSLHFLRRARDIENTPLSLVRSAAQGAVELEGNVRLMPGPPIVSPLSNMQCVWWSYKIERREDKHTEIIAQETSDALFHLDDGTGCCIVDPVGAEVLPSLRRSWRGAHEHPGIVPKPGWDAFFTFGPYTYTERLLQLGDHVYAQGWFRTQSAIQEFNESRRSEQPAGRLEEGPRRAAAALRQGRRRPAQPGGMGGGAAGRHRGGPEPAGPARAADPDLNVLGKPPDHPPLHPGPPSRAADWPRATAASPSPSCCSTAAAGGLAAYWFLVHGAR